MNRLVSMIDKARVLHRRAVEYIRAILAVRNIIARNMLVLEPMIILIDEARSERVELLPERLDAGMRIQPKFFDLCMVFFFRVRLIENMVFFVPQIDRADTVGAIGAVFAKHEILRIRTILREKDLVAFGAVQ